MPATFTWCPAPGASRERKPRLVAVSYGDGYQHRATIGINILNDRWSVVFAGDAGTIDAIDAFLDANAVPGFWWRPPGAAADILVTCDQWTLSWSDRGAAALLGSIAAEFNRSYNTQPA